MKAEIDLVAVAYQAPQETMRFLQSLDQVEVPFTLVVVENCSPDPMVRDVLKSKWDWVSRIPLCVQADLLISKENIGYASACNLGASYGTAPAIALLNCDTEWRVGVGSRVLETLKDEQVGVVGPRTTDLRGYLTHSGIVKSGKGNDAHRFWRARDMGQASDVLDVPTVSGATYFIRRSVWDELATCPIYREVAPEALGAFLPTKHYFEETFCSYHARSHGWRIVYDGGAHMIHEWNRSDPHLSSSLWNESRDYFLAACEAHGITGHGVS